MSGNPHGLSLPLPWSSAGRASVMGMWLPNVVLIALADTLGPAQGRVQKRGR
jgi:hypothetical protein